MKRYPCLTICFSQYVANLITILFSQDFLLFLWYCVVLTGGAVSGKHYKRAVARQHHTARGQSDEFNGDERAPWVHVKASRGLGEKLY